MKTLITALTLIAGILHAEDESSNYLNFIIQTQNNEVATQHLLNNISPTGNGSAPDGVTGSSVFSLWTIHRTELTEYLLDEKTVSSYHPVASVEITSLDPYKQLPRTRIDHPFKVKYTIDGLVTNNQEAQDAAKSVLLEHQTISYGEAQVIADSTAKTTTTTSQIDHNGTTSTSRLSGVTAPDLTQARGNEIFTVYARPDFGVEKTRLSRATVQVWPIAQATITGIDKSKSYMRLPDIHLSLVELYPDSTTYIRVYKGAPRSNPKNPYIINTSYVKIDDVVPQDRKFAIAGVETGITQEGSYTIEVIHETPFGSDILAQTYPLTKKKGLKIVGTLNSSE